MSETPIKSWKQHQGRVLDTVPSFDVIDCTSCGFAHIIPIPTTEELAQIYQHEYYMKEKPLYAERQLEDLPWWNLAYGERYDTFEKLLPANRRRILDVGSGPGYFMKHGRERGWTVKGIEPSSKAAAHSRSMELDVVEAFLDESVAGSLGKFDVVHMSEVLEHIPDPIAFLSLVRSVLSPDGILCVVVPNDYSPFQNALRNACGYKPWWVAVPHHINYFNFESLGNLFNRTGFDVVLEEATFPIDLFLLMGDNYIGKDDVGRACHGRRKTLELNLEKAGLGDKKREVYRALAGFGIGREVMLFGSNRG